MISSPPSNNLVELAALIPPGVRLETDLIQLKELSPYSVGPCRFTGWS